jgi:aryl-phospho-beta-D-glucosidase BglC (GH1 family)
MTDAELIDIVKEVDPGFLDDSHPFKEYIIGLSTLKKIVEKAVEKAVEKRVYVLTNGVQEHIRQ